MIFPLEGARGRKTTTHNPLQLLHEIYSREEDLCRVRIVCRALSMTWISPPARLHHIVLVPKKNLIKRRVNQLSEQRWSCVLLRFPSGSCLLFSLGKDG